ncbi:MAG: DUF1992 domain-containing protein [Gordonia sp. (in: high G+C Gram-positive bacteria)]|uniref:DnaJ family domain-containing protein n=1 Tax=Gordonia sp. (in: high G+C Gram-positive bacteria) TaxID=84139 RepID=UPI0039E50885
MAKSRRNPFRNTSAVVLDAEVVIALMAERQIQKAVERGDLDDLPGSGKPLDLTDHDDPDWWLKRYLKREGLVMLPPAIQLRKDDEELDAKLDELRTERSVRDEVAEFNQRVAEARYRVAGGPPLITAPRDVEETVSAWRSRRSALSESGLPVVATPRRRRWWHVRRF